MRGSTTPAVHGRLVVTVALTLLAALPMLGEIAPSPAREIAKSPGRVEASVEKPKSYGTEDYGVTVVPAVAFYPASSGETYFTSRSLGRSGPTNTVQNFYAAVDLPDGVVVDYIGLNSTTDAPNAVGAAMYVRTSSGTLLTVGELGSTVHGWATDYNTTPFDFQTLPKDPFILHVQQGDFPTLQFFGGVEVWWRRTVRPYPLAPTFNDVPVGHLFFQFIEALADSGITGGCGGGNFCPDEPVKRGQMAVFLAKALGLHWGQLGPP